MARFFIEAQTKNLKVEKDRATLLGTGNNDNDNDNVEKSDQTKSWLQLLAVAVAVATPVPGHGHGNVMLRLSACMADCILVAARWSLLVFGS